MMASWEILPLEIMTDILARLSVPNLIRLRMVSKQFSAIIKSQSFAKLHLSYSMKTPSLFKFHEYNGYVQTGVYIQDQQPDFHFSNKNWRSWRKFPLPNWFCHVEGICNGLVLIVTYTLEFRSVDPVLILWNPATRKSEELPLQNCLGTPFWMLPFEKQIQFGFGYDEKVNDFKVVQFHGLIINNPSVSQSSNKVMQYPVNKAAIYSLSIGEWKLQKNCLPTGYYTARQVHINGVLFWLGFNDSDADYFILSFDLSNELFTKVAMPMPVLSNNHLRAHKLWELCVYGDDSLALLTLGTPTTHDMDLWVMKKDSERNEHRESWMKMHTLRLEPKNIYWVPTFTETIYGLWKKYVIIKATPHPQSRTTALYLLDINGKHKERYLFNEVAQHFYVGNYVESLFPVCKDEI